MFARLSNLALVAVMALAAVDSLPAQSVSGTYSAPNATGGQITLTIQQSGTQVTGQLAGNGSQFRVSGQMQGATMFSGVAQSQQGSLYIAAEVQQGGLAVVLAEMGPNGQPNQQTAQQLMMTRSGGGAAQAAPPAGQAFGGAGAQRGGRGGDPFVGTFAGAELSIQLQRSGNGYSGMARSSGGQYPIQATVQNGMMVGTYVDNGMQRSFQAQVQGDLMQLMADGQTFQLERQGGGGAGAGGAMGQGRGQGGAGGGNLAATAQDQQLAQLLLRSPWCSFRYSQTLGTTSTERIVFTRDGRFAMGSARETQMSNQYGQMYGSGGDNQAGMWRVQNGNLMLSQDGAQWGATPLQVSQNSNGYPIVTANGKEYSMCN